MSLEIACPDWGQQHLTPAGMEGEDRKEEERRKERGVTSSLAAAGHWCQREERKEEVGEGDGGEWGGG